VLDGGEWSTSRPSRFTRKNNTGNHGPGGGPRLDISNLPEFFDLYDKYEPIISPKNEQVLTDANSNILHVLFVLKRHVINIGITTKSENRMQLQ